MFWSEVISKLTALTSMWFWIITSDPERLYSYLALRSSRCVGSVGYPNQISPCKWSPAAGLINETGEMRPIYVCSAEATRPVYCSGGRGGHCGLCSDCTTYCLLWLAQLEWRRIDDGNMLVVRSQPWSASLFDLLTSWPSRTNSEWRVYSQSKVYCML